jgi:hypothetical protein
MSNKPLFKLRIARTEAILDCQDLDQSETLVLLAINSFLFNGKDCCWPTQTTLAQRCKMHRRSLLRIVERLRTKGFLATNFHDGRDFLEYRIIWAKLRP